MITKPQEVAPLHLSALSCGPELSRSLGAPQAECIIQLLRQIKEPFHRHVMGVGEKVADLRVQIKTIRLDANIAASIFKYYYHVRSNLSHRGKVAIEDFDRVGSPAKGRKSDVIGVGLDTTASSVTRCRIG